MIVTALDGDAKSGDDAALRLEGVGVSFGHKPVLSDISLSVQRGDVAVVIGGSGAGKTTLARVMIGLVRPTTGRVWVDGLDIAALTESQLRSVRAKFGMVFQYSALLDSLSVLDNVALPLREHTTLPPKEIAARVKQLLSELELEGSDDKLPAELSGGMRKRVALARALIRNPQILIYDEPASGLDPLTARLVDDLICKTRDRFGVTSVVISHDMAEATKIADRIYLLDRGQLVAQGRVNELVNEQGSLAARLFAASGVKLPDASPG